MYVIDFKNLEMNKAEQTRAMYVDQLLSFWMESNAPCPGFKALIGNETLHTFCMCRPGVWQDKPLYGLIDKVASHRMNGVLMPLDGYIKAVTRELTGTELGLWNLALSKPVFDWSQSLKFKDLDAAASFATDVPTASAINAPAGIITIRNIPLGNDVSIELAECGFTRFNWTDYLLFL